MQQWLHLTGQERTKTTDEKLWSIVHLSKCLNTQRGNVSYESLKFVDQAIVVALSMTALCAFPIQQWWVRFNINWKKP